MPPHASLSSRDGRSTSSSYYPRDGGQYYYSNDDVEILHQVVSRAEEILPSLPERDRLATTALFRAADFIFPSHGLDSDDDKFARILFKMGGNRRDCSLLEKFEAVLGDLGIELEFVTHEPARSRSPSVHSARSSSPGNTLHSGTFPVSLHHNGRRRRNSDSIAQIVVKDRPNETIPRKRSVSLESSHPQGLEMLRVADVGRQIDPWLAHVPSFKHDDDLETASPADHKSYAAALPEGLASEVDSEEFPVHGLDETENDIQHHEQEGRHSPASHATHDDISLPDHEHGLSEYDPPVNVGLSHHAISPELGHPLDEHSSSQYKPRGDIGYYSNNEWDHRRSTHTYLNHDGYQAAPLSVETGQEKFHPFEASASASVQSDDLFPRTPASAGSAIDSEGFRGASDTTVQDEMDLPPPKSDPAVMAKLADTFFLHSTLLGGSVAWYSANTKNQERKNYAVQMDKELSGSEAVLLWSDKAGTVVHEVSRLVEPLEDELEEEVPEGGSLTEYRDMMMRRAGRAYDISIMHKAFTHWQAWAEEEVERTEVARRHLLRKKIFGAWCEQKALDDVKVNAFTLKRALRVWCDATAEHRESNQASLQVYQHNVVEEHFLAWLREHQGRTAELWRTAQLKVGSVTAWKSETEKAVNSHKDVSAQEARAVLDDIIKSWKVATNENSQLRHRVEEQEAEALCDEAFEDWQKQASLERRLREFQERMKEYTRLTAVYCWKEQCEAVQHHEAQAQVDLLQGYFRHWQLERRLASYNYDFEMNVKSEVIYNWMQEERLIFFERYREEAIKKKVFNSLVSAVEDEGSKEDHLLEIADRLTKKNAMLDFVCSAREEQSERDSRLEVADEFMSFGLATEALGALCEGVADHDEMELSAQRGAYYVSTANALSGWADYAREMREERLRSTYHHFRRNLKRNVASDCISTWIAATDASLAAGWEADEVRAETGVYEMVGRMNYWISVTNDNIVQQNIAEEAETEAYITKWRLKADECQNDSAEAANYDYYGQLNHRWSDWEVQSVQVRGRKHTAAELYEKNNKRMCRQVMRSWHDEAFLDEEEQDLHSSYVSRHSVRSGTGSRLQSSLTTLRPNAGTGEYHGGFAMLDSSHLKPITEYDEEQSVDSRLRIPGGYQLYAAEENPNSVHRFFASQPTQAVRNEPLVLPHRFRSAYMGQPGPLGGEPAMPESAAISHARSVPVYDDEPNREASEQGEEDEEVQQHALPKRFISLQKKLLRAERLSRSVQLGPMSEFDEDEEDDEPAQDDVGQGQTQHRFMDTPTRWTGIAAPRNTTTPMAPLPSPYERQLRQEYSSRGILTASNGRQSLSRPAQRVTFADLRDEDEEEYDVEHGRD